MTFLQHFAQSILDYLENGGEEPAWFYSNYGLCFNWAKYGCHYNLEDSSTPGDAFRHCSLRDAFKHCDLHSEYPFNKDFWDYDNEQEELTLYKNPERLAFLHKLAKGDLQ